MKNNQLKPSEKTTKVIRDVVLIFVISFFISGCIYFFRKFYKTCMDGGDISVVSISFTSLLFVLLVGFTVSDFWNRFLSIGDFIDEETSMFIRMIRILKGHDGTQKIIDAIKAYSQHTIDFEWSRFEKGLDSSSENEDLFRKIIDESTNYIKANPFSFISSDSIYDLIPLHDKLKTSEPFRNGGYVANLNALCAIFAISSFAFVKLSGDVKGQFAIDFGFIVIIMICLYMIYEFRTPFTGSFSHGYEDFEAVISEANVIA